VGQFSGNTQVGSGVAQGFYGDGSNLAVRAYNSASSDIYFQTYGGAHSNMIIKNNGNVGIGTNSPGYTLDVNGTGHAADTYVDNWFRVNGGGGIYWQSYGGGFYMQDSTWIRSYNGKYFYESAGLDTGGASGIACGGGLGGGYTFRVCGNMAASAF